MSKSEHKAAPLPAARGFRRWAPALFWSSATGVVLFVLHAFFDDATLAARMIAEPAEGPSLIIGVLVLAVVVPCAFGVVKRRRDHFGHLGISRSFVARIATDIATAWGAGLSPVAPGTFGAIAALPAGFLLARVPWWGRTGLLAGATWIALIATRRYLVHRSDALDPSEVVVDETIGMLLALAFLPWDLPWVVAAFVLFRALDILKPGPVGYAERRFTGALGVMLDDVVAGLLAGGLLACSRVALAWLGVFAQPSPG